MVEMGLLFIVVENVFYNHNMRGRMVRKKWRNLALGLGGIVLGLRGTLGIT